MLADDAVMVGDGGGRGAVKSPVTGALQIARFAAGLGRLAGRWDLDIAFAWVNGQPGAVGRSPDGTVVNAMTLEIADDRIVAIHSVVNPEKLRHVGPQGSVS